jgi:5-formyltetrahydrofolate cyclo-ligase
MGDINTILPEFERYIEDPPILRKKIIEWRKSLPFEERQAIFTQICNHFYASDLYQNATSILAYHGKISSGEFDTSSFLTRIIQDGKVLLLPKVNTNEFGLQIFQVANLKMDLKLGSFGIIEPDETQCNAFHLSNIDLIIVPGLIFDTRGFRYGYGKGYYDWLLEKVSKFNCFSVGFVDQRLITQKQLKIHNMDRPVRFIFTNENFILTSLE